MRFRVYNIKDYLVYPEFAFRLGCLEPFIWSGEPTCWNRMKRVICLFGATSVICQILALLSSLFVPRTTAELYEISESKVFEALALTCYFGCGFHKFGNIFWRRDDIGRVMDELTNLFPGVARQKWQAEAKHTANSEGKIHAVVCYRFAYYEEKARIMMQRLTRYFMFTYFYYNIIPILQLSAEVLSHQESIRYKPQSNAWYPWHNHNNHSTFVGFVFSFLIQAYAELASIAFIMSGEFLFCFFNTQMQLHFDYLTSALSALDATSPHALLHLKTLINYHNQLLRLSKLINSIFNCTFTLDLIITTFAISLMALTMVMVRFGQAMMFFAGFSFFLIFGYIFCHNGDEFLNVTKKLDAAIFYSNWYEGSPEYRRMIIFFLMRTQTPCEYRAYGYMALSTETYMRILKLSYQLFTSFRAIG